MRPSAAPTRPSKSTVFMCPVTRTSSALIAEGLSNAETSERLYISDTTVKTHVSHILQKLDLRDRVQAFVLAYQTGLFEAGTDGHST